MERTFEKLENRQMMAGDFVLADSIILTPIILSQPLYVEGTSGNDSIYVSNDGLGNIVVNNNGVVSSHWDMWISKVVVNTHGGNDYVYSYSSTNRRMEIRGGDGDDTLYGGPHNDIVEGGGGSDWVFGQAGDDTVDGGVAGAASYYDNYGTDRVYGGPGADTVFGSDWGSNTLSGDDGADSMYGGYYADTFYGGYGNDYMSGSGGNDSMYGSFGNDNIWGGDGDDLIRGQWDNDSLVGENGNDTVHGDDGHDWVYGFAGNDKLYAGAGDDCVLGGLGDDTIVTIGGGAYDQVWGEGGFDSFWTDSEVTEQINDADYWEAVSGNIHRVSGFYQERFTNDSPWPWDWTYQTPSRELNGQNFVDPDGAATYQNFSNRPLFASTGPVAGDVDQGGLGDCYFLAPLSSVAKVNPNTIRQSVVELGDGTYAVRFFSGGTQHFIRVDGDLPTNGFGTPSFAGLGTGNSTWVAIMEKAWAHFRGNHGDYGDTEYGWMDECYSALGKSTSTLDVDWWYKTWNNSDNLWAYVCDRLSEGRSVTVGTHGSASTLVGGHAYMVDYVYYSGSTKMVRLRNPWGAAGSSAAYVNITAGQLFNDISRVQSAYV